MNISIQKSNATSIVTIDGRIDTLTADSFESQTIPLITEESPNIILNCTSVDYISSTGLRVFIICDKQAVKYNGTVTIRGLQPFLKEIFDVSGLTDLFTFE